MKDLFSMAEIDSEAFAEELGKNSAFFNNVREAAKAAGQEATPKGEKLWKTGSTNLLYL